MSTVNNLPYHQYQYQYRSSRIFGHQQEKEIFASLLQKSGQFDSPKFVECKSLKAAGVFLDNAWMGDLSGTGQWLDNQ